MGVSVAAGSNNQVFGKRREQHVIILASGDRIRHMTIRPWMIALTVCFLGTMASAISVPQPISSCATI